MPRTAFSRRELRRVRGPQIDATLYERLRVAAEEDRQPIYYALRRALELYLQAREVARQREAYIARPPE